MDYSFISERITMLLEENHVSACELSMQLGKCKSYINKITSRKTLPSLQGLYDICEYFGITPDEFFSPQSPGELKIIRQIQMNLKELDASSLLLLLELTEKCKKADHTDKPTEDPT